MTVRPLVLPELGAARAATRSGDLAAACRDAHAAGYAEGLAEGRRLAEAEFDTARAELEVVIGDLRFKRAEAAIGVMESLRPLLEGLVARVFPGLRGEAFLAHAIALASERLAEGTVMRLRLAPSLADALDPVGRRHRHQPSQSAPEPECDGAAEAAPGSTWPILEADRTLSPGRAILEMGGGGEWEIDFDGLTAALAAAIEEFFSELRERKDV